MRIPPRRALLLSNGITLSYLDWRKDNSEGAAIPLLLLHGMADHALVWLSLGNALPQNSPSQNYHIVAPDLRGHGESSKRPYVH